MRDRLIVFTVVLLASFVMLGCPPVTLTPSTPPATATPNPPTPAPTVTPPQPMAISATQISSTVPISTVVTTSATAISQPTRIEDSVVITVTGVGIASSNESDPTRRERAAIRAAELDAKKNVAEWVEGTNLEHVAVSKNSTIELDTIKEALKANLRLVGNTIKQEYDNNTGEAKITVIYTVRAPK